MTLQTWITERYSTVGTQLGFVANDYAIIVTDTLEILGITLEADVLPVVLHATAKVTFWKKCLDAVTLDYTFSADGSSYHRSDMVDMIMKNLSVAESEALPYSSDYVISLGKLVDTESPYEYDYDRDFLMGNT